MGSNENFHWQLTTLTISSFRLLSFAPHNFLWFAFSEKHYIFKERTTLLRLPWLRSSFFRQKPKKKKTENLK